MRWDGEPAIIAQLVRTVEWLVPPGTPHRETVVDVIVMAAKAEAMAEAGRLPTPDWPLTMADLSRLMDHDPGTAHGCLWLLARPGAHEFAVALEAARQGERTHEVYRAVAQAWMRRQRTAQEALDDLQTS